MAISGAVAPALAPGGTPAVETRKPGPLCRLDDARPRHSGSSASPLATVPARTSAAVNFRTPCFPPWTVLPSRSGAMSACGKDTRRPRTEV